MSKKIFFPKYQRGFALLEVMISALVLAVGVIAFVKLGNVSMKRTQENNYLSQATASANALVEVLRGNPSIASWLIDNDDGNFFIDSAAVASYATQCQLGDNGSNGIVSLTNLSSLCSSTSTELRQDLRNELLRTFSQNFQNINGKAVLCMRTNPATTPVPPFQVHVAVIWKYTYGGGYTVAAASDCPTDYNDPIPDPNSTLGTANPDRGYFEMFTTVF